MKDLNINLMKANIRKHILKGRGIEFFNMQFNDCHQVLKSLSFPGIHPSQLGRVARIMMPTFKKAPPTISKQFQGTYDDLGWTESVLPNLPDILDCKNHSNDLTNIPDCILGIRDLEKSCGCFVALQHVAEVYFQLFFPPDLKS